MSLRIHIFSLFLLIAHQQSSIAQSFDPDEAAIPFIGKSLPFLESKTLRGNDFKTTDYIGNGVLVHIWSLSCAACFKELPDLNLLSEQYKTKGIKIISFLVEGRDTALQQIAIEDNYYHLKKKIFGNDKIDFEIVPISQTQAKLFVKQLSFPVDYFIDFKGLINYYSEGYFENFSTQGRDNYEYLKKRLDLIVTN